MGIPHAALEDDVVNYKGKDYFIPAGSSVFVSSLCVFAFLPVRCSD